MDMTIFGLWVTNLLANSANQYFKQACNTLIRGKDTTGTHCGDNYEIKLFHATQYTSHIRDLMARLLNTLRNMICEEKVLPRAIVFVLDNDMIKYAGIAGFGMSLAYGKLLHFLLSEVHRMIQTRKDYLPLKAKKQHFPEIIWINPPFHCNFANVDNSQRNKFSRALDTTAAIYEENWSLKLKRIWNPQSSELFLKESQRFTTKGFMTYWMAVDRTIRYWDTALSPLKKVHHQNAWHQNFKNQKYQRTSKGKFFWKKEQ